MMEKRWPRDDDGMVRIPYYISGIYNDKEEAHIARAFEDFENNTCIRYCFHSKHFPLQLRIKFLLLQKLLLKMLLYILDLFKGQTKTIISILFGDKAAIVT